MTNRFLPASFLAVSIAVVAGCDSRSATTAAAPDLELVGKTASIEYRPLPNGAGVIQKQRTGVLKKVTADWVVVEEQGTGEVAIPRDMVLEIRVEKK